MKIIIIIIKKKKKKRFHLAVSKELEKNKINVIEVRIPLSPNMRTIQSSLIECLEATLLDVKKLTNYVNYLFLFFILHFYYYYYYYFFFLFKKYIYIYKYIYN